MRKRRIIALLLCVVLVMSMTVTGCKKDEEKEEDTKLSVEVEKVGRQDISVTQIYTGEVRGENEVMVMPKVAARVISLNVKAGDRVQQGQTLMVLDSSDFTAAVRQAQAALDTAKVGKRANDVQVESARRAYERVKKLHSAGAASDLELETAKATYDSLTAGSPEAAIAQAEVALSIAREGLDKCVIRSPISGVVGNLNVSLGDTASPQSPVAMITTLDRMELAAMVPETDVPYVKQGASVKVWVRAVSDDPLEGRVKSIATVADPVKRGFEVKIALSNPGERVKSGMFGEVALDTVSKENVLAVPVSAVVPRTGGNVVFTVDKNRRARSIEVKTGIKDNEFIEITSGLKEGQRIITKGNTLVSEGTRVRVIPGGKKK